MVSGSEILSYKGNPELAYGEPGIDIPRDRSGIDSAVVNGFNSVIQQGMQQNLQRYNQAVKDRDETLKLATEQDIDVPILDEDRASLEAHRDRVKDIVLKTPDLKNHKAAYLDVQKEISAFNEEKAAAKTRQVEIMKLRQSAAANTDPEYRKAIAEHIKTEVGKGVKHIPMPYMEQAVVDETIFPKVAPVTTNGTVRNANGLMVRDAVTETPLKSFDSAFDLKSLNSKQANELVNFADRAAVNPDFMTDAVINPINAKIDAINARTGESRPHIATKNEQGEWVPNPNKLEFAKAFSIYKDYQYGSSTVADKDMQANALKLAQTQTQRSVQNKNNAAAENSRAAAGLNRAKVGTESAHAKVYLAAAEKYKKDGDKVGYETAKLKSEGAKVVDDVVNTFHGINQGGDFKPISSVNSAPAVAQVQQLVGAKDTDEVADISGSTNSATVKKMLAKPNPFKDGKYAGYQTPVKVFMVRGSDKSLNGSQLVGVYGDGSTKAINSQEAINTLIATESNFVRNTDVIKREDAANAVIKDLQGSSEIGMDLDKIIENNGVVGIEEDNASAPSSTTDGTELDQEASSTETSIPMSKAEAKKVNGAWSVKVNGKYRKVVRQNSKTGVYYYK